MRYPATPVLDEGKKMSRGLELLIAQTILQGLMRSMADFWK